MRYLIILSIFLVGCNPCKQIAKNPTKFNCFPADTIKIINDVIHYETEYIINDSIIRDTVPCDPITNTYYKTKTVYKTKYSVKIDTIYEYKQTSKINPINNMLEQQNDKLTNKVSNRNKIILILSGVIILIISLLYLFRKFL